MKLIKVISLFSVCFVSAIFGGQAQTFNTNQVDFLTYFDSSKIPTETFNVTAKSFYRDQAGIKVTKIIETKEPFTKVWSTKDAFIEDAQTGIKYFVYSSSIGIIDSDSEITTIENPGRIEVEEVYNSLPIEVKFINIGEGDKYFVKNLRIR